MRIIAPTLTILAALLAGGQGPNPREMIGKPAPALSVEKWLNTDKGAALSLEKLKGKVVVLDFWAFW